MRGSVVNAGDGTHEHPTQALLDAFTMRRRHGRLEGLRVTIVGDVLHSRVARSNVLLLHTLGAEVTLVAPPTLLPVGVDAWPAQVSYDLDAVLPKSDVVMMLRVQRERMGAALLPERARVRPPLRPRRPPRRRRCRTTRSSCTPGPMVRGMEIAPEVADGVRSTIVEQVANGVSVRMAVLYLLLGGAEPAIGQRACVTSHDLAAGTSAPTARASPSTCALVDGRIAEIGAGLSAGDSRAYDAAGGVLLPGLVDLHTHLREPGREDAETVETGTLAAALGGFTAVHAMANTDPVADTAGVVEQVWRLGREAGHCDVAPVGAVTVGLRRRADGRARHDGRQRRPRAGLLRRRQVRQRRQPHAPGAGVRQGLRRRHRPARAGAAADRRRADERGRQLLAARPRPAGPPSPRRRSSPATACSPRTSAAGCTSATSAPPAASSSIRWAKSKGWDVTAEVTPHHLLLTDDLACTYDPVFKVNPPLRTQADVEALRAGLADGTIDCVATDHAPHALEDKEAEWGAALPGMTGLETALAVVVQTMVEPRPAHLARRSPTRLSETPARIGRLEGHGRPLAVGEPANLVPRRPRRALDGRRRARWPPAAATRRSPAASCRRGCVATFLRGRPDRARRHRAGRDRARMTGERAPAHPGHARRSSGCSTCSCSRAGAAGSAARRDLPPPPAAARRAAATSSSPADAGAVRRHDLRRRLARPRRRARPRAPRRRLDPACDSRRRARRARGRWPTSSCPYDAIERAEPRRRARRQGHRQGAACCSSTGGSAAALLTSGFRADDHGAHRASSTPSRAPADLPAPPPDGGPA